MYLTKFQKHRIIFMEGNNLFIADMLSRSFTQGELQLNQLKSFYLPPQSHFATLTHAIHIKPDHFLVKHETVLPSQKDYCLFLCRLRK